MENEKQDLNDGNTHYFRLVNISDADVEVTLPKHALYELESGDYLIYKDGDINFDSANKYGKDLSKVSFTHKVDVNDMLSKGIISEISPEAFKSMELSNTKEFIYSEIENRKAQIEFIKYEGYDEREIKSYEKDTSNLENKLLQLTGLEKDIDLLEESIANLKNQLIGLEKEDIVPNIVPNIENILSKMEEESLKTYIVLAKDNVRLTLDATRDGDFAISVFDTNSRYNFEYSDILPKLEEYYSTDFIEDIKSVDANRGTFTDEWRKDLNKKFNENLDYFNSWNQELEKELIRIPGCEPEVLLKTSLLENIENTKFDWPNNEHPKAIHFKSNGLTKGIDVYYHYDDGVFVADIKGDNHIHAFDEPKEVLDFLKKYTIQGYELKEPPFLHQEQQRPGIMYILEKKTNEEEQNQYKASLDKFIKDNPDYYISKEKYESLTNRFKDGWHISTSGDSFDTSLRIIMAQYDEAIKTNPAEEYRIIKANCIYNTYGISNMDVDYKRLEVLPKLENIEHENIKVKIHMSESSVVKKNDVYSLDEANLLFEKASKQVELSKTTTSTLGKIKEVFLPAYNKISGLVEISDGTTFGFRYDAGSEKEDFIGYLKEVFDNTNLNNKFTSVISVGDMIIDKDYKNKFVSDIKNGKFECFNVETNKNQSNITDLIINDKKNVIKGGTLQKLDKKDIIFRSGHLEKSEVENTMKRIELFKAKGLVNEVSDVKHTLKPTISNSLGM